MKKQSRVHHPPRITICLTGQMRDALIRVSQRISQDHGATFPEAVRHKCDKNSCDYDSEHMTIGLFQSSPIFDSCHKRLVMYRAIGADGVRIYRLLTHCARTVYIFGS